MLTGKSAVVTGSTSGIGKAIAEKLARDGTHVMINGFGDAAEIKTFCANLAAETGVKVLYSAADMSKAAEIKAMMQEAADAFGGVDILVNNAGIQHVSQVDEFPEDKWDAIIAINMNSNFHTIKAAVPYMKQQGWGRIINVASAHGLVASPYKAAYVAAKHGVVGMTKTIALELAEQGEITVNSICPGFVRTPLVEGQVKDQARVNQMSEEEVVKQVILASQPTKRFIEVEEVADLTSFLCSSSAKSITGAQLSVDGAWTAR